MSFDVIVVGGGIAGLTTAAFLSQSGRSVLLCEKEERVGGLVGSFTRDEFVFDAGIRALENSGVLFPMLRQLGIEMEFLDNPVSIGIADRIVTIRSEEDIAAYQQMLTDLFPEERENIAAIVDVVYRSMTYMDVLYGIDNPLFMDLKHDTAYLKETLLPWLFRYIAAQGKIKRLSEPVEEYLAKITQNRTLIDMIAQHFFRQTPASFALSYFSLYLDYKYPKGGTGALIDRLWDYILEHGGTILTKTSIEGVNPAKRMVYDRQGNTYVYGDLVWAADSKALYAALRGTDALPKRVAQKIEKRTALLVGKEGGDSVLTLYITAGIDVSYFQSMHGPHFFYTPQKIGLSTLPLSSLRRADGSFTTDEHAVMDWVKSFLQLTTYEISIPAMRDARLAPAGNTGLIISTLMDHALVRHIANQGWYESFKSLCRDTMIETLKSSVYPVLEGLVRSAFVSTPLTLEKRTGNTGGAITGWAFTNDEMPAVSSMPKIAKSIDTPIPHVVQAGQWTYSPAGFPISIRTGKIAADAVLSGRRR